MLAKEKMGPNTQIDVPLVKTSSELISDYGIKSCPIKYRHISHEHDFVEADFLQIVNTNTVKVIGTKDYPLEVIFAKGLDNDGERVSFIKYFRGEVELSVDKTCYVYVDIPDSRLPNSRMNIGIIEAKYTHGPIEPSEKNEGDHWYDSENHKLLEYNGSEWKNPQLYNSYHNKYIDCHRVIIGKVDTDNHGYILRVHNYYPNKLLSDLYDNWISGAFAVTRRDLFESEWNDAELENLTVEDDKLQLEEGYTEGTRIIELDISHAQRIDYTKLEYMAIEDEDNYVQVQASISVDNGETFSEWIDCNNDESIPLLPRGMYVYNCVLKIKQKLVSNNNSTPKLVDFWLDINSFETARIITPENLSIKDDEVTNLHFGLNTSQFDIEYGSDHRIYTRFRILDDEDNVVYETTRSDSHLHFPSDYDAYTALANESIVPMRKYKWQCQHEGARYAWSNWSEPTSFYINETYQSQVINITQSFEWEVLPNVEMVEIFDNNSNKVDYHINLVEGDTINININDGYMIYYYKTPVNKDVDYVETEYHDTTYLFQFEHIRVFEDQHIEADYIKTDYLYPFR